MSVIRASVWMIIVAGTLRLASAGEPRFVGETRGGEQVLSYEVELDKNARLIIDLGDVDVWVREATDRTGRVEFFVSGPDMARARDYFENELGVRVEGDAKSLVIRSRRLRGSSLVDWKSHRGIRVWAVVTVPRKVDADIATADGDLQVEALQGDVALKTGDGDVALGEMSGELKVESADGDVDVASFSGTRMDVQTADGDFRAGSLHVESLSVRSADGKVALPDVVAGSVTIRTHDGDVSIGVDARVLNMTCTDGDLVIGLKSGAEAELRAQDGDIRITIPRSLDVDLDLKGESVSVRGALNLRGRLSDRYVSGSLNDGGPRVRAETTDGDIVLYLDGND